GIDVLGVVVDANGAPVDGAAILVTDSGCYPQITFSLARSAGDGTFRLRSLGSSQLVGARLPALGTSEFVYVEGAQRDPKAAARMRLVLPGAAGSVGGQVIDREGHPLAGALVSVGRIQAIEMHPLEDGYGETPPAQHLLTDAEGRFLAAGMNAGAVPLRAW